MGCTLSRSIYAETSDVGHVQKIDSFQSDKKVEEFLVQYLSSGNVRECVLRIMNTPGCKDRFIDFLQYDLPRERCDQYLKIAMDWSHRTPMNSICLTTDNNSSKRFETEEATVQPSARDAHSDKATLLTFAVLIKKFVISLQYKEWRASCNGHVAAAVAHITTSQGNGEVSSATDDMELFPPVATSNNDQAIIDRVIPALDSKFLQEISFGSQWVINLLSSIHDMTVSFVVSSIQPHRPGNPILYANTAFLSLMNVTSEQARDTCLYDLLFKHDLLEVVAQNRNANEFSLTRTDKTTFTVQQRVPDSTPISINLLSKCIYDTRSQPQYAFSLIFVNPAPNSSPQVDRNLLRYEKFLKSFPNLISFY